MEIMGWIVNVEAIFSPDRPDRGRFDRDVRSNLYQPASCLVKNWKG